MKRGVAVVILVVMVAACDGGADESTTLASGPTTTTEASSRVCGELAEEAIGLIEDLVEVLDDTRYEELIDRSSWSDQLIEIEERGAALQAETLAAGCDPGAIQQAVAAAAAGLEADSGVAELLVDLISP